MRIFKLIPAFLLPFSFSPILGQKAKSGNPYGLQLIESIPQYCSTLKAAPEKALVDLAKMIPGIKIELPYTQEDNFMKQPMYPPVTKTYLRKAAADALRSVSEALRLKGYRLLVYDAYRPYAVTMRFWELVKDERYVANPANGSGHNRGLAVDLTLLYENGQPVDMGTGFDNFSDTAHHSYRNLSTEIISNRKLLKNTMEQFGFRALDTEWWHYSWPNDKNYELLDLTFKELEVATRKER